MCILYGSQRKSKGITEVSTKAAAWQKGKRCRVKLTSQQIYKPWQTMKEESRTTNSPRMDARTVVKGEVGE